MSLLAVLTMVLPLVGCDVNSFADPSRTGRFMETPTTMPILDRIDVIEPSEDLWGQTTTVRPEDLVPSNLSYRLHPGDGVRIEIYELYQQGQWYPFTRDVDAGGYIRIPQLGDILAAGMTAQELQNELEMLLARDVMSHPTVHVAIETSNAFTYTIQGHIQSSGRFTLRDPNLRVLEALAMAGGAPLTTRKLYIVRKVTLSDDLLPHYERERTPDRPEASGTKGPAVDIESIIQQLDDADIKPAPAAYGAADEPMIDIDDLQAPRLRSPQAVDVDDLESDADLPTAGDNAFIYVPEKKEWVRVESSDIPGAVADALDAERADPGRAPDMVLERVIEIPYQPLLHGDNSYNAIIRPDDQIYVDGPPVGIVYIDGEVTRPGVYTLPQSDELTLSRLIAAAGGLGALAIPDRVDLTRIVGDDREATIRLNLAAIRRRTEPDVYMKANDHVIVGTNWMAYPLAVFRNGLRMTYGFGFLLDRNFGNDVFGPPPTNIGR
ncbi:MAG: polysaccharide biosynthesis/export family protein [Planctomycetota bacterium]|nr:polysaccharide biosynthesis/export family protein [Planctomycetota bacterium]